MKDQKSNWEHLGECVRRALGGEAALQGEVRLRPTSSQPRCSRETGRHWDPMSRAATGLLGGQGKA